MPSLLQIPPETDRNVPPKQPFIIRRVCTRFKMAIITPPTVRSRTFPDQHPATTTDATPILNPILDNQLWGKYRRFMLAPDRRRFLMSTVDASYDGDVPNLHVLFDSRRHHMRSSQPSGHHTIEIFRRDLPMDMVLSSPSVGVTFHAGGSRDD